jgi:Ca2+-transporting ATPase
MRALTDDGPPDAGRNAAAPPPWHALAPEGVADRLGTDRAGLAGEEARARLARVGPNRLRETPPTGAWTILWHQFRSPLIYILLVAGAITLLIGHFVDASVIGAVLALNATIGFLQEKRAEESVRSLLCLASPKARALRDGRMVELDSAELVPGDVVVLESGTRVPADLRLFRDHALRVDESLLTGESLPVAKQVGPVGEREAVADRTSMAYTGSVVATGRARGFVVATGAATELGAIARSLEGTEEIVTPMQARMARFARVVALAVVGAALLAFVEGLLRGEGVAEMFLVAVTLAVSGIPEGLPVVVTITLAVGVRRMAARNAVIRRLPAVETLGSTTVIGTDKTGTLTENRMTVLEIVTPGRRLSLEGGPPGALAPDQHALLEVAVLSNEASLVLREDGAEDALGDPTEVALLVAARRLGFDFERARVQGESLHETPFEPELQHCASVRRLDGRRALLVKGAPERVLAMCALEQGADGSTRPLDRERALEAAAALAGRGLRLLGYARRGLLPDEEAHGARAEGMTWLGLTGMMDPPRAGVRESIAACRRAGIRVLMITGDHARTAGAIGRELGLGGEGGPSVMSGEELAALDEAGLGRAARERDVFARVAPEQKLAVVRALRRQDEVVAVTGDGVNDAPALKAADVGIAMGRSGTDVAREAADMVLTDDDFVSIAAAVEEGRVTFGNLRKVTFFLVSTGAAEVSTVLVALALGWPLPYLPAQILWLNLVTNGVQDVALAFEPGDPDVLSEPPRPRREGILSALLWERTVIAGLVMTAGTLSLFRWELAESGSLPHAQTVALTTMVLFQAFHAGNSRSERRSAFGKSPFSNPWLFLAVAASLGVHVAALYVPWTQFVLRVEPLADPRTWVRMTAVAATIVVAMELHKWIRRRG